MYLAHAVPANITANVSNRELEIYNIFIVSINVGPWGPVKGMVVLNHSIGLLSIVMLAVA